MTNTNWSAAAATALALLTTSSFAVTGNIINGVTGTEVCIKKPAVCVRLATTPLSESGSKTGYRWGGEDIEPPRFLVSQLNVTVGGDEVFVPISAFVDLGTPRDVEVTATHRGFDVIIRGGDAATAYRAILVFERRSLIRRRVQLSEFPIEAAEETKYRFNLNP